MAKAKPGKKGDKYGIHLELLRDLTPEEADFVDKTLEMTASALRLHLKEDVAKEKPTKPGPARPK
jgi:hypothetical protein